MRLPLILAASAVAVLAVPAAARDHAQHFPNLRAAIDAGCHVQQVHTPAGKIAQSAPIVRCTPAQIATAKAARTEASRAAD
ncbi:hypothetical protein M9980_08775 [Sphingomonas donggukensis]|uniref:UrcA family protein n=1 Tax=Sphingomonas donggukensis TaxID=2949093 RepID=A0ABY4TQK4_9SPHN|nr:hypothetical protein [Sphingomonas donggukensis]URW74670.1 hypothetical protein M9980_08775 [Sphingomonas donggukensis]